MIKLKTLLTEALNISNVETELIALNNEYPQYGYGLGRYMGSGIPEDAYDFPGGNKKEADEFYDKAVDIVRQVSPNFNKSVNNGFDSYMKEFGKIGFFEG